MIDETGKVSFNEQEQAELDRIIEERISRERSKYSGHDELKGIVEELQAVGYQGTPKEIRDAIKTQREEMSRQEELAALEVKAKEEGTTPALLAKIEKLEKQLSEITGERQAVKRAEENKQKADEAWNAQVKDMQDNYPDVDLAALAEDAKFKKFAKGKNEALKQVYEDFVEFIGETEAQTIAKVKSKEERSTGSGKGNVSPGGSYGLTDNQKRLAKENGMTEKQYADLLSHVK